MSSDDFFATLKGATPARICIGRAGERYTTHAQLKFREDLAASRDTVYRDVSTTLVDRLGLLAAESVATSRRDYLLNTAAGRKLSDASARKIVEQAVPSCDIQLVVSEGLSTEAFENNVPVMLPLLLSRLREEGITVGTPIYVRWARVAIVDQIGEILRPKSALILIGERPGLGISDSLSGYFEYSPSFARVESDRNVLCNIHKKGVPPEEAALMLAQALLDVLRMKKSGMSVRFDFT